MYDPNTGRWLSEDPIGFAAGDYDLYRYVGNDPTNVTDPSGLRALKISEKTSVAIFLNTAFPLTEKEFSAVIGAKVELGGLGDIKRLIIKALKDNPATTFGGTAGELVALISLHYAQADAVTLPSLLTAGQGTVIKTKNLPDPEPRAGVIDANALALVSHELVHAVQIERGGKAGAGFLASYLGDYLKLTASGVIGNDAYRYNLYEIEAYSVQIAIQKVLGNNNAMRRFQRVMTAYKDDGALKLIETDADAKALSQQFLAAYNAEHAAEMTKRNAIVAQAKATRNKYIKIISPGFPTGLLP